MYLVRLIYASRVADGFNYDDIEQILTSARKHNLENNVSGLLCYSQKYFLQCLEGSRSNINHIYNKIITDKRHTDLVILDYQEICRRQFSDWSMGYVPDMNFTKAITLQYSISSEFDPYQMSGESAHLLLKELSEQVAVI